MKNKHILILIQFNISGFVNCNANMSGSQANGQEIWPESSQTFGFVRARKRHTVIMEGFLERASGETNAGKGPFINYGTQFWPIFDPLPPLHDVS